MTRRAGFFPLPFREGNLGRAHTHDTPSRVLSPPFQGGVPTQEAGRVSTSDAARRVTAGSLDAITTVDAAPVENLPASSFDGARQGGGTIRGACTR
jgi:hypothetical protein